MKEYLLKCNIGGVQLSASAIFTAIAAYYKKVPTLLWLFLIAVIIDYGTGWVKANFFLKDWNSKRGVQGIIKKVMYFVCIGVAFLVGYSLKTMGAKLGFNLSFSVYIGWYVLAVFLINELTSILENLYVIMPDKIPVWLIKGLKIADNTVNGKINDMVCKNQDCEKCDLKDRCNLAKKQG